MITNKITGKKYEKGIGFCREENMPTAQEIISCSPSKITTIHFGGQNITYEELIEKNILPYFEKEAINSCVVFPLQTPFPICEPASTQELEIIKRNLSNKGLDVLLYDKTFAIRL